MTTPNVIDLSAKNPSSCYETSLEMHQDGYTHDEIRDVVSNCQCKQCQCLHQKYILSTNTLGINSVDIFDSYNEFKCAIIESIECAENQDYPIHVVVSELETTKENAHEIKALESRIEDIKDDYTNYRIEDSEYFFGMDCSLERMSELIAVQCKPIPTLNIVTRPSTTDKNLLTAWRIKPYK